MRPQIYEKDGVNYLIRVRKAGFGYLAEWTCDECSRVKGGFNEVSKTEEEAIENAKVNLSTHHKLKHSSCIAAPRRISRRAIIAVGVIGVLGAFIVYMVTCVDLHDWQAIQGEWREDNGYRWSFGDNGLVDTPAGRYHYSINPVLHTIGWGDSWMHWPHGTYELKGDRLKIWLYGKESKTLYILERVE
jgi:hypothetical protein